MKPIITRKTMALKMDYLYRNDKYKFSKEKVDFINKALKKFNTYLQQTLYDRESKIGIGKSSLDMLSFYVLDEKKEIFISKLLEVDEQFSSDCDVEFLTYKLGFERSRLESSVNNFLLYTFIEVCIYLLKENEYSLNELYDLAFKKVGDIFLHSIFNYVVTLMFYASAYSLCKYKENNETQNIYDLLNGMKEFLQNLFSNTNINIDFVNDKKESSNKEITDLICFSINEEKILKKLKYGLFSGIKETKKLIYLNNLDKYKNELKEILKLNEKIRFKFDGLLCYKYDWYYNVDLHAYYLNEKVKYELISFIRHMDTKLFNDEQTQINEVNDRIKLNKNIDFLGRLILWLLHNNDIDVEFLELVHMNIESIDGLNILSKNEMKIDLERNLKRLINEQDLLNDKIYAKQLIKRIVEYIVFIHNYELEFILEKIAFRDLNDKFKRLTFEDCILPDFELDLEINWSWN